MTKDKQAIDLEEYKLHCIENELSQNTLKNYLNTLEQLNDFISEDKSRNLNKATLIQFKQALRVEPYNYRLSTCNQKITVINIYLNWLGQEELSLKLFKEQSQSHRESISEDDFNRLLRYSNEEMKLFILTIANTGLRVSELCQLTKSDLDLSIIEIENKGKVRIIDIPLFLKKKLRKYMQDKKEDDLIFYKTQQFYRKELKVIAGKSKVKKSKVYPHSFRHYFAKKFIADGGDSVSLMQMLGHGDIKTTTIYTKLSKEELAKTFRSIKNK